MSINNSDPPGKIHNFQQLSNINSEPNHLFNDLLKSGFRVYNKWGCADSNEEYFELKKTGRVTKKQNYL